MASLVAYPASCLGVLLRIGSFASDLLGSVVLGRSSSARYR